MKKDSVRFTVCIHKELFERLDYVVNCKMKLDT